MSIRVMTWAWSAALPPTSKLVLMALADIADDVGVCWPSHSTLATKCSLTDRTVRRVLCRLQSRTLIFVEPRLSKDGSRTSNRYRLAVDTPPDNLTGGVGTRVMGGGHRCPGAPDTGVLGTTTEPSIEPSLPPPAPDPTIGPYPRGGSGGDFVYARSLTSAQRHALQDRLTVLSDEQAQQVLDELSGRMAIAQVKNPIRYCATLIKRMRHGEFLPELGLKVGDERAAEVMRRTTLARPENGEAIEPTLERRELPAQVREVIERMRTSSRARSKREH